MRVKTFEKKNVFSKEFLARHWPGLAALVFFLYGFILFKEWDWAFYAPVFFFLIFKLTTDYWPVYLTAILYTLCFPHAGLGFLGFVCFIPILLAAMREQPGRGMFLFWLAGFFAQLGKIYWVVYPMSEFSPIPFSVGVLFMLILCAILALFWAVHFRVVRWAVHRHGAPLWLIFSVGWVFWDHLLTWFLTGFPWETLGCAAYHIPYFNQTFDLFGALSVGWVLAFGNAVGYEIVRAVRRERPFPKALAVSLAIMVAAGFVYGLVRTGQIEKEMAAGEEIKVGVLQGNVTQLLKREEYRKGAVRSAWEGSEARYRRLGQQVVNQGAELIVLPETALSVSQPRWLDPVDRVLDTVATTPPRWSLVGLSARGRRPGGFGPKDKKLHAHNSAMLLSPSGDKIGWYDKNRMVPFSEFLPYKASIEKVLGELSYTGDYELGGYYAVMPYPRASFGVFICYESVYPQVVRRLNNTANSYLNGKLYPAARPSFLVTITNDAWFGKTSAPYQHWAQVAIRAIENRRYIPRAANTGISGAIDPLGRSMLQTALYVEAAEVVTIRTMNTISLYSRIGDLAAYVNIVIYWLLVIMLLIRGRMLARRQIDER